MGTDEAFLDALVQELLVVGEDIDNGEPMNVAVDVYHMVLKHLLDNVINPKDSARGIIFGLQKRLKELE